MSLLDWVKAKFAKDSDPNLTTPHGYAIFPAYLMTSNEEPFKSWRAPDVDIPNGLEDFFKGTVFIYQLFIFHAVTASKFGSEFAEKILAELVAKLNEISDFGNETERGIRQIYRVAERAKGKPSFVTLDDGRQLEAPLEYHLAIEFLLIGGGAPFGTNKQQIEALGDTDFKLAQHLEHGKQLAIDFFERLANVVKIAGIDGSRSRL